MLTRLSFNSQAWFGMKKVKSVRQRVRSYMRYPDKYVQKTSIRPPNLRDPSITYPIRIPLRVRHFYKPKKQLFIDNTSKIHWNRLEPNQILLGFEKIQYLEFYQTVEGLKYLSEIKEQTEHDWNEHEWVKQAMDKVRDEFMRIKKSQVMRFYYLMKKINYKDEVFWKKMYKKIEQYIYEIYPSDFQHIYTTYYHHLDTIFSPGSKENFTKLMEGRIREFTPEGIIKVFHFFLEEDKLDTYWFENVFISLFKNNQYTYNAKQIGQIFRFMLILNHEENKRLYDNLYLRIQKLKFKNQEEIEYLKEVLLEVKEIFTSHRIEPSLMILDEQKEVLRQSKREQKKTLEEMVKEDLAYFCAKRKIKAEERANATA